MLSRNFFIRNRLPAKALLFYALVFLYGCQTSQAIGDLNLAGGESSAERVDDSEASNRSVQKRQRNLLGVKLFGAIANTVQSIDALSAAVVKRANYSIERIGNTLLVAPDESELLHLPAATGNAKPESVSEAEAE